MSSQLFDRRITLQRPVHTRDAAGGVVTSWEHVSTVWARRLGAKGREFYAANREIGEVQEVFHIRYSSTVAGILPTWRVLFEGKVFAVGAAVEMGRREFIAVTCTTGASNG
jgi:SPP1 family predicted phage head-tail adaptor